MVPSSFYIKTQKYATFTCWHIWPYAFHWCCEVKKAATITFPGQVSCAGTTPVPMNITWYVSPSVARAWLTMMRVNVAPLRTSRGFSPIGWMAWSMRGLSLINWRVRSGRSRDWVMPSLRAALSIHWRGKRGRKQKREDNGIRVQKESASCRATRKKKLPFEISLCF